MLSIELCIPVFNESRIIAKSIKIVAAALRDMPLTWQIIVADNGSTDGTASVVESLHAPQVRILSLDHRGKGAAIVAAARASTADLFGYIDADLSADPRDMEEFIRHIENGDADIVIGSRLIDVRVVKRGLLRSLSSKLFNVVRKMILGIRVADSQCGFKIMNTRGRKILSQCTETGWFMDPEFLLRAEMAGLIIREMPVHWDENYFPSRKGKLRMMFDGWEALHAMIRIRRLFTS